MKSEKNNLGNVRHIDPASVVDPSLRYVMVDSHNDEINLLDLWLVLTKRRSLFLALVLLALLAGISFALIQPEKYNYSTAIEIGGISHDSSGRLVFIEDPASVLAKINQSYIPLVTAIFLEKNPEFEGVPDIKAKLEKNSNIIFLDIKGPEKNKNTYIQLLNSVVDTVKLDHQRISALKVKDLELSKYRIENEIARLNDQEQLILSQNKRLDKKEELLADRIKETRTQLNESMGMKKEAASESRTEGKALALMMVDSELRSTRDVLAQLEEQLLITLENKREVLLNKLTENKQQQTEKTILLEKLEIESKNLLETRAITRPIQSVKSVGMGKMLVVIISLLAGIFIAIFAVFFAEFISKAKKHAVSSKA